MRQWSVSEMNRGISRILKHTHLSIFVSALYLMADIARGELHYANAGHPTPLWVHRERRSAEPLPLHGWKPDPVLGIFGDAEYHSASRVMWHFPWNDMGFCPAYGFLLTRLSVS